MRSRRPAGKRMVRATVVSCARAERFTPKRYQIGMRRQAAVWGASSRSPGCSASRCAPRVYAALNRQSADSSRSRRYKTQYRGALSGLATNNAKTHANRWRGPCCCRRAASVAIVSIEASVINISTSQATVAVPSQCGRRWLQRSSHSPRSYDNRPSAAAVSGGSAARIAQLLEGDMRVRTTCCVARGGCTRRLVEQRRRRLCRSRRALAPSTKKEKADPVRSPPSFFCRKR